MNKNDGSKMRFKKVFPETSNDLQIAKSQLLPQIHVLPRFNTLNPSPISLCFGHGLAAVRSALFAFDA